MKTLNYGQKVHSGYSPLGLGSKKNPMLCELDLFVKLGHSHFLYLEVFYSNTGKLQKLIAQQFLVKM
jgi:hypothetical protein